jgi:hypothetical protein
LQPLFLLLLGLPLIAHRKTEKEEEEEVQMVQVERWCRW